ncbi:PLP-dependent aminotransferase family protein [Rhodovulum sp. DZ06]|uniref:MocR-like pyridoxine biosynthesis transcription factor PdxR n=1 Tax=Rhodovulum sp. DZ06 TaxID=3425126 RepID=UPI003D329270
MSNHAEKHRSNLEAALFALGLERGGGAPMHAQLAEALRALILTGRHPGARMPASRALAAELSVSRMTVTTAYDQLTAEGYLHARRGDGTYVAEHPPHLAPPAPRRVEAPPPPADWSPFHPGAPDQALFPHRAWARRLEQAWRKPDPGLLGRADPFGWPPLRAAIAAHLSAWRGLDCRPGQVVITAGAWDGFDIIRHAALAAGDLVAVEDPGWPTQRELFRRAGLSIAPVRVDGQGLDPEALPAGAAAAVLTPSRHYPTGAAMPVPRRMGVLGWAEARGALVIEDDYDSEFRYQGRPFPTLAGLDGLRRVIYMGSFSKLLSPALRLGYLVLPEALLDPARAHLAVTGARASLAPQPALAAFMQSGEFATHLRRMRRVYARRQAHLLAALAGAGDVLSVAPDPSGMHLVAGLGPALAGRTDVEAAAAAGRAGLLVRPLSAAATLPDPPQGLLLGYSAADEEALSGAAASLVSALRALGRA